MSSNEQAEKSVGERCGRGRCGRRRFWKFPFIVAAIVLVKSVVVMALWNLLVPDLFHGPVLDYLQALELTVLAKLLVGFGGRPGFGRHMHGRHRGHWGHHERWKNMTDEERQKLREELRKHWER